MHALPSIFIAALAAASPAYAATLVYTNDFNGADAASRLPNEVTDTQWNVDGGTYNNIVGPGNPINSNATIDITNANTTSFIMSTQFTVNSFGPVPSGGDDTLGFGLYGSDPLYAANTNLYIADFAFAVNGTGNSGRLRVLSLGAANGDFTAANATADADPGAANVAVVLGNTYTLRLAATRSAAMVSFALGLFDATGTTQIGGTATATDPTALTGIYFGYRNRYQLASGTTNISFDNLLITPEPGISMLGTLGLAAILTQRRRPRNFARRAS